MEELRAVTKPTACVPGRVEFMGSRVCGTRGMKAVFIWTLKSAKDETRKDVVRQMDVLHT